MGFCGFVVLGHNHLFLSPLCSIAASAFVLNWMYMSFGYMLNTVRKIELHKDGKTVSVHPRIGSVF